MGAAKRILRYLRGKPELEITYNKDSKFGLSCYSDASYARGNEKSRSVTGSIIFLAGGPIHFGSQLQRITAQSTSESELIAMNTTAKHGVYFAFMLGELGWGNLRTFKLFGDNRSALLLAASGNFSNRSRHIAVRYAALRDWIKQGIIELDFVASAQMLADICTKYCVREVQDQVMHQIANFN